MPGRGRPVGDARRTTASSANAETGNGDQQGERHPRRECRRRELDLDARRTSRWVPVQRRKARPSSCCESASASAGAATRAVGSSSSTKTESIPRSAGTLQRRRDPGIRYCSISSLSPGESGAKISALSRRKTSASGENWLIRLSASSTFWASGGSGAPRKAAANRVRRDPGALTRIGQHEPVDHRAGARLVGPADQQGAVLGANRRGARGVRDDDGDRGVGAGRIGGDRLREILDAAVAGAQQIGGGGVGGESKRKAPSLASARTVSTGPCRARPT